MQPKEEAMAKIGLEENKAIAKEVADKAMTLVKNTQDIFPISPEKYKRVLLVDVKGTEGGFGALIGAQGPKPSQMMKERLEKEGFEVSIWESPIEKLMELPMEERRKAMGSIYAAKRPITDLTDNYDLIINLASVNPNTDQRIQWPAVKVLQIYHSI